NTGSGSSDHRYQERPLPYPFVSSILAQELAHVLSSFVPGHVLRRLRLPRNHRADRLQTFNQALGLCVQIILRVAPHLAQNRCVNPVGLRNLPDQPRPRLGGLESLHALTYLSVNRLKLSGPVSARFQLLIIRETRTLPIQPLLDDPVQLLLRPRGLKPPTLVRLNRTLVRLILDLLSRLSGGISGIGHADYTPFRLSTLPASNTPHAYRCALTAARDPAVTYFSQ